MKGIIYITDAESGIGKVLFDDGAESKMMSFPGSYESGDIVELAYLNNDPRNKVIRLEAISPILHYGSLMVPKSGALPRPVLIANYPLPLGLIGYNTKQISFPINHKHRSVCFRVRKDSTGRLSAFDVQQPNVNELHKCTMPFYGVLSEASLTTQEAYISAIDSLHDASILTGVVSRVIIRNQDCSNEYTFGFIDSEQAKRVYFNANEFRRVYNKEPEQGMSVFFTARQEEKGHKVNRFHLSDQINPLNQSITIKVADRDFRVPVSRYKAFAGKDPVLGSLVTGFVDDKRFILQNPEAEPDARYVLNPALGDEIATIQKGRIHKTDLNMQTGEIRLANRRLLGFSLDDFSRSIGGYAHINKELYCVVDKSGNAVSRFCTYDSIACRQSQFKNFAEPLPHSIYRAFRSADNRNIEVFKADLNNLSEAIACYKSADLSDAIKLPAIETLIRNKYQDQRRIILSELKAERIKILQDLIEQNMNSGHFDRAIEYELRLQDLHYDPKGLTKLSGIPPWFDPISAKPKEFQYLSYSSPWNISSDNTGLRPSHEFLYPAWDILFHQPGPEPKKLPERAWSIDLGAIQISETGTKSKTYYNIKV